MSTLIYLNLNLCAQIYETSVYFALYISVCSKSKLPGSCLLVNRFENESQPTAERATREVRKGPSLSGPLMLPNRASANSLSAPIKSSGGTNILLFLMITTTITIVT